MATRATATLRRRNGHHGAATWMTRCLSPFRGSRDQNFGDFGDFGVSFAATVSEVF